MIDPLIIPIVSIVGAFSMCTIVAIAYFIFLIRRLERETALKQDLVLRGFSADEIADVLRATSGGNLGGSPCRPNKSHKHAA